MLSYLRSLVLLFWTLFTYVHSSATPLMQSPVCPPPEKKHLPEFLEQGQISRIKACAVLLKKVSEITRWQFDQGSCKRGSTQSLFSLMITLLSIFLFLLLVYNLCKCFIQCTIKNWIEWKYKTLSTFIPLVLLPNFI